MMVFKISKASDPVKLNSLLILIYGTDAVGKTSLGFMSGPDTMLLNFNMGTHRAAGRRDCVDVYQWSDLNGFFTAENLKNYKTIVIDTGGSMIDCMVQDLIKRNPKLNNGSGGLKWQGTGHAELSKRFNDVINTFRKNNCNVVIFAHSDTYTKDDNVYEIVDMKAAEKKRVLRDSDQTGRLYTVGNGDDKRHFIDFRTSEFSNGKDPASLGVIEVPDFFESPFFLDELVHMVKTGIESRTNANVVNVPTENETIDNNATVLDVDEETQATVNKFNSLMRSTISDTVKQNYINHMDNLGYAWQDEEFVLKT